MIFLAFGLGLVIGITLPFAYIGLIFWLYDDEHKEHRRQLDRAERQWAD